MKEKKKRKSEDGFVTTGNNSSTLFEQKNPEIHIVHHEQSPMAEDEGSTTCTTGKYTIRSIFYALNPVFACKGNSGTQVLQKRAPPPPPPPIYAFVSIMQAPSFFLPNQPTFLVMSALAFEALLCQCWVLGCSSLRSGEAVEWKRRLWWGHEGVKIL